jgi:hypothetical protein
MSDQWFASVVTTYSHKEYVTSQTKCKVLSILFIILELFRDKQIVFMFIDGYLEAEQSAVTCFNMREISVNMCNRFRTSHCNC